MVARDSPRNRSGNHEKHANAKKILRENSENATDKYQRDSDDLKCVDDDALAHRGFREANLRHHQDAEDEHQDRQIKMQGQDG